MNDHMRLTMYVMNRNEPRSLLGVYPPTGQTAQGQRIWMQFSPDEMRKIEAARAHARATGGNSGGGLFSLLSEDWLFGDEGELLWSL